MTIIPLNMVQKAFKFSLTLALILQSSLAFSVEDGFCSPVKGRVFYTIQTRDQLGDIVRTFGLKPLWGARRGYVGKVAERNKISDPNKIYPGDSVELPFKCEQDLAKYILIESSRGREIDSKYLVRVRTNTKRTGEWRTVLVYPDGREVPFVDEEFMFSENISQKRKIASTAAPEPLSVLNSNSKNLSVQSRLSVLGTYDFYRIDSTSLDNQSEALILSEPSYGVRLLWNQLWSDKWASSLGLRYSSVQLTSPTVGQLENTTHSLGGVHLSGSYFLTPNLEAQFFANYGNYLFSRAITIGTARIDLISQTQVGFLLVPQLIQRQNLSLAFELGVFQNLPQSYTDYKVEKSDGYILAPRLRQKLDRYQIELKLKYESLKQTSSISEQKNTQVGVDFGVSYEVGP
jgi:hypothetical protein